MTAAALLGVRAGCGLVALLAVRAAITLTLLHFALTGGVGTLAGWHSMLLVRGRAMARRIRSTPFPVAGSVPARSALPPAGEIVIAQALTGFVLRVAFVRSRR
ncbi:MAG TPA: hypothetical protein VFC24_01220 [Casimicrobiaceae bacterium]|nr:hypothetical protein [Casimicrobiaceae bacterium]